MKSYHNTVGASGELLDQFESKAKSQDVKIMEWFTRRGGHASPNDVLLDVFGCTIPLTSVRRALSNLTKAGLLVKSDYQVMGPYGRLEHLWKLPTTQIRLF